ncbi:hypothetical protein GCWU000325_02565 [Alloprevotella tannerae ATCC 51259]|uniref:Uncharacterized protein n=1 Tax=Alloprevotella tannerae ATCC 51259 TaxID=626522 RepID=C9LK01_9BACT|nr:hypothetical protein GCWU000325_02565 [Alloprevotella tannerae ATCC 51259]
MRIFRTSTITVLVWHTVRSAGESILQTMPNKELRLILFDAIRTALRTKMIYHFCI